MMVDGTKKREKSSLHPFVAAQISVIIGLLIEAVYRHFSSSN